MRELPRIDLRLNRANQLTAHVMHIVMQHICDHDPDVDHRHEVSRALQELFYTRGVEIITDADRATLGLSPRGADGWTADEIIALEKRRMELLTKTIVHVQPIHEVG